MSKPPATAESIAAARAHLAQVCRDPIKTLRETTPGVVSATVATSDGFTLASTLTTRVEADKLSATAGSINALGAALTRQAGRSAPVNLMLESENGKVVSMSVSGLKDAAVLTVVTSEAAILGDLLWACRKACERIALAA